MIHIIEIIAILFIHWIADFFSQSDAEATGKSTSNKWLIQHTSKYSLTWLIAGVWLMITPDVSIIPNKNWEMVFIFVSLTFVFHTIQDYITGRINKGFIPKRTLIKDNGKTKLFEVEQPESFRKFFNVIGIDQFLHYSQLFICYLLIFK